MCPSTKNFFWASKAQPFWYYNIITMMTISINLYCEVPRRFIEKGLAYMQLFKSWADERLVYWYFD